MSENKNTPRQSDGLNAAFELVSRQIDGDLSETESAELAAMESASPAEIADFRQRCIGIQTILRQMPVVEVNKSLYLGSQAVSADAGRTALRGRPGVVWGSITVVIAACLLLSIVRPWEWSPSIIEDRDAVASVELRSPAAPAGIAVEAKASGAQVVLADAAVAEMTEGISTAQAPDPSIRTLLESSDWNIVVVKLNEKDRDRAMEQIQSIVRNHGLRVKNATGNGPSDFLGVVLTSAVSENEELLSEMEQSVSASPVERDQNSLPQTKREEIVAAIRRSLQSPTQNELHHGQMYLALSTGTESGNSPASLDLADSAEKDSGVSIDRSIAAASVEAPGPRNSSAKLNAHGEAQSKTADRSISAMTVVVFEFDSSEDTQNTNPANKQI